MNFRSIRDKRIDKFGKKKNGAGSPYGGEAPASSLYFFLLRAGRDEKKINGASSYFFLLFLPKSLNYKN